MIFDEYSIKYSSNNYTAGLYKNIEYNDGQCEISDTINDYDFVKSDFVNLAYLK